MISIQTKTKSYFHRLYNRMLQYNNYPRGEQIVLRLKKRHIDVLSFYKNLLYLHSIPELFACICRNRTYFYNNSKHLFEAFLVSIQFHNNSKHQFDTLESVTDKVFYKIKTSYYFIGILQLSQGNKLY